MSTELEIPGKKIAIVGFTSSHQFAPWGQDGWELWVCNNLHGFVPDNWHRLYDLHDYETIASDKEHEAFLRTCQKPVVVWKPRPEWPASVAFPKDAATEVFGRYFTNSISWMTAHAIMEIGSEAEAWAAVQVEALLKENEGLEPLKAVLFDSARNQFMANSEIHIYGVDMAQGTEYAAQRPSCEYFLGLASGMGIKTYVPPQSDLLKVAAMYGVEDDSALRIKLDDREKELKSRMDVLTQNYNEIQAQLYQLQGALETTRYFRGVWINPAANRDGSKKSDEALEVGA